MSHSLSPDAASWLALSMVYESWPAVRGEINKQAAARDDMSPLPGKGVQQVIGAVPG